jgi:hypothetical protein
MSELQKFIGIVRRVKNLVYGYKKSTGRPRGKTKRYKN